MVDEQFWIIFSAIATALGSLATTAAVIVALWQTQQNNKKKLMLSFNETITILDPNTDTSLGEYIGVSITNIGNRDVIISDWSMICTKGKSNRRYKIMTEIQGLLKKELPYALPIEENLDLSYERKYFARAVNSMIKKNEISPNKKVKFQIMDSTGKKYIVHSKQNASAYASEYLEQE